ncbi:hypothetical protein TTHERM_00977630 (macronuclear) [Tetrahymena thermophila SB210]|uniref:Uncharacterized protein n=1 Tax=Tetrahymena thermophila (strain SB210) TaxID=312017 RepID=Q24GP7_TETTS|nr:hypothetical protein TTHERM_00977630 [Tetrahymena thermophila SB210]EAS06960.2 hypothetical protein TTHERM_00977630 [Tetrahymena thermophila SB210]|eukprot:XP_001027202.2 hypothetical protein TTHERM_00977630 [Tetrahymena thermophila SB210]
MNSFNQSSSNNNKENVVNLGSSAKPSTAPPAASSALSFREKLEQQLKKAKELQKLAQIDLEITKKDSVKKDEPAPTLSTNIQNPTAQSSVTTTPSSNQVPSVSMVSSFSSRFSSILQRDQNKTSLINTPLSTTSTAPSTLPAITENKFSAISSRLSQLRESLNQTLSNSEIKLPSQPVSQNNRETKSEIRDFSDNKQSINKSLLLENNKQTHDSSITSIISKIKSNIQSSTDTNQVGNLQIKKNEDNNPDCIIVEEKSTLKPKQAEVEMCIEIEANPKDLIQQKMNNSTNKSYFSNNSIATPKHLESSLKMDSSIKSNTSSINKLSSNKEENKNGPNTITNNQTTSKIFQENEKQGIIQLENNLQKSNCQIKDQTNVNDLIANQSINSENLQSVKSLEIQNQGKQEDQFQDKPKQISDNNSTSINNYDLSSKFQQNQKQNDILKIIENIPSSSESDLSQINSQPNSQQTQDQQLFKQETKAIYDINHQSPILQQKQIQDDIISNKQFKNDQNNQNNGDKYETQEDQFVFEEKNPQNELNETKQQNIISEDNLQKLNSIQNSDLNLSQNLNKNSAQKYELNQTAVESQLKIIDEDQYVNKDLNEQQQIIQTSQNIDEEINKTNHFEQESNAQQNNQEELKNESQLVQENNITKQIISNQFSQLQSNQVKSTSQISQYIQQEIQPLSLQKSEEQSSFQQNLTQTQQNQNEISLEKESSKQSAQKLSQLLDTLDRMEEEEENEQKIETETIQNQNNILNEKEITNAQMDEEKEEEIRGQANQMDNLFQNNPNQDDLLIDQQISNNQTNISLESKNQVQIEESQMKPETSQSFKQEDTEQDNKSVEKLIASNKSSLQKDQSLTKVINQIEECEKLDKIIDENDEENQSKTNQQQIITESIEKNQNEKNSMEKFNDSNKSSLQKDKSLSSILSQIEEFEKMEDEDEKEEIQVSKIDQLDHFKNNNLLQNIQMDQEKEIEMSKNNQQLLEQQSTQNNQLDINEKTSNQNEYNQQIDQNNLQSQKEELKQQDQQTFIENQNNQQLNEVQESNSQQEIQIEMNLKDNNQVINNLQNDIQPKDEQSEIKTCQIQDNDKEINQQEQHQINSQLLKIIDDSSSSSQSNDSQEVNFQQNEHQQILNIQNENQQLDQIEQENLINDSDQLVEVSNDKVQNTFEQQNEQIQNINHNQLNQFEEYAIQDQNNKQIENIETQNQQNSLVQENLEQITELNVNINQINQHNLLKQTEQIEENKEQNDIEQLDFQNDEQQIYTQVDILSKEVASENQQQSNEKQQIQVEEKEQQITELKDQLPEINKHEIIEVNQQSIHEQEQQSILMQKQQQYVEAKEQQTTQSEVNRYLQVDAKQQISELKQQIQVEDEQIVDQVSSQITEQKNQQQSQIQEQYHVEQIQNIVENDQSISIDQKQQQNCVYEVQQLEQEIEQQGKEIDEQQQQQVSQQSIQLNTQIQEEEKLLQQSHIEEDLQQKLIVEQNQQIFQCVNEVQQQQKVIDDKQQESVEQSLHEQSAQQREQKEEFSEPSKQQLIDQQASQKIQGEEKQQKIEENDKSELVIDTSNQLEIQEEKQVTSIIKHDEDCKHILLQSEEIQQVVDISNEKDDPTHQTFSNNLNNIVIEQQNEQILNSNQIEAKSDQNHQQIDSKFQADGEQILLSNSNNQIKIQEKSDDMSQIEVENENNNHEDQQEDAMEIETQIDEQPDHLNQDQFDQILDQNQQKESQYNNDDKIKQQDSPKTKETEWQIPNNLDILDYINQKQTIQKESDYQKISDVDLKKEFDEKEYSAEFIKKSSPNSLEILEMKQNISNDKKEEQSYKSEIKLGDANTNIGSVMLDMEKFLKQKGLSDLKNQSTVPNSEIKNENVDIVLSTNSKLTQVQQEDKQNQCLQLRSDQSLFQKEQDHNERKNLSLEKKQIFDIVNINNNVLSQMDQFLIQKSSQKDNFLNGDNIQEKQEIEQIESADKNYSFGNNSENIFERIKRESDKKLQESGFQISSDQRNSLIVTNIFTPSNAKAISDCGGAQTQFSNESFGITPKRINFLQSNKKSEAEATQINTDSQFQQLYQSKLKIADDQKLVEPKEELTQNTSNSNISSQLNSSNENSKLQMSSELKMRTPLNHQVVLQIDEKKNPAKAPSSYTVISNRNNVLKSPVLSSLNNDKKTLKSNLIRDRSNSKSPGRQGLNLPQNQIEKPKGKSPLRQGLSLPKSAMRDDLSISSVNLSRFDLENEEYESKNLQNSSTTQKRISIQGDLAKIAQTLGIPKHNRNQCQLIENIYNLDKNVCKFMLNQSGKNIFYQSLALLDDSIPNHFIVVVTNQFMTLRSKMNKQVSWACINSLMGVETLVQVQNLLMERKIKLLFIQQEYLLQEQYKFMRDQIKMIIYEDMTDKILEINEIYNIQRYHLFHTMTFKTLEQVNQICEKYTLVNIDEQIGLYGFDFSNINWTFESDKEKSLINFIRKNNLKKVIMYIDKSKKIEEIVSSFNQKGLKMQAYNSQKQDQIQQLFSKDQFEILCCYNGQYIPKQIKQIVQYYIHYHIPRSVTSYVNDLNGYQYYHIQKGFIYEKFACGFLTELDFFEIRSDMVQELTEKKLIQTVLKTLNSNGTDGTQNKKKAGPAISDDFFFNVVLDETEQKIQEHYNNFMKDEDEFNLENEQEANIKQIQITKFINENCIKREVLIKILSYIAADQVQIMPFQGVVKMIQKNQLANNKIVSTLLKNNQNKTTITFSILDLATELQMTSQELNRSLKKLNAEKKLQYEVKEELALLTIKPNIDQILDKLFEQIRFQEEKQINDLDTMYLCAKLTCNLTLEQVFKYQKYKDMNKNSNQQEEGQVSLKVLLEKYLNESKGNEMCEIFTNIEKSKLPFISLKSQREKSNLLKDIQNLVPRVQKSKLNLVEFQLNKDFSQMDFESQSRFISLILQGIDGKNINEFKPALQFKKYFKYDYFDILQISFEYLQSYYTSLLQSETSKKIKI